MRGHPASAHSRVVGLDVGTKRVGIAVSDPLGLFAQPRGAFSPEEAVRYLRRLASEEGIERLIVGWPLTLDDEEGDAVTFVRAFVKRIEKAVPDVPWTAWDERFSTEEARARIREAGVRKMARRDKRRVDAASAALILQEYLDELERLPGSGVTPL